MKLTTAEFEEPEYRGGLFNQLATNQFVWEPGQVFEQYVGIDYALLCTHPAIAKLFNWGTVPPPGVELFRYNLDYIWLTRGAQKKLPPFRLNMFVQAKRPTYGRYAPAALKAHGLRSPFWRFETTAHQQGALIALSNQLGSKAVVTYASPAFHKSADLYRHTINGTMVESSTFPDIALLANHDAWNYSAPGATGVANADPVAIQQPVLTERLNALFQGEQSKLDAPSNLTLISQAVSAAMESANDFWRARFAEGVRTIEQVSRAFPDTDARQSTRQFLKISLFTELFQTRWFVLGTAEEPG